MQRVQKAMYWAILASETSHVFCCVLPTLFSIMSLLAGIGLAAGMPGWLDSIHHVLHAWEIPLILLSGFVVALGWALHFYSEKIDCHDTGCHHGTCAPRKKTAGTILKIATILFLVNVSVYTLFHRGAELGGFVGGVVAPHAEHEH
ncbi:MAG: hypothetical protein KDJ75_01145 [Alphaproteobacteria bacterium]|nr:hypothetical protein [Alphaproteobacteria bacterium]